MPPLIEIKNLHLAFNSRHGRVNALKGVTLAIEAGDTIALVGESGSGKSVTAHTILGLLPDTAEITQGSLSYKGQILTKELQNLIRGKEIGTIFQDALSALNPTLTTGTQILEVLQLHLGLTRQQAKEEAIRLFGLVGLTEPEKRLKQYPFELSGGMRQRVMIAIAIACKPSLLIADEPTTALDVTIQAQILRLLTQLKNHFQMSILFITHDLSIVSQLCNKIGVMYYGRIVEFGFTHQVLTAPQHPYTQALIGAIPAFETSGDKLKMIRGNPPNVYESLTGCAFHPRCPHAMQICVRHAPLEQNCLPDNRTSCWLHYRKEK